MNITLKLLLSGVLLAMLSLTGGCSCGFDCNSDDDDDPAILSLGLSDSLPEDLKQVVIDVDAITFRRSNGEEVKVDTFTIDLPGDAEDLDDAPSVKVNLLNYPGRKIRMLIDDLAMPAGSYNEVQIKILVGSVNLSYVQLATGEANDQFRVLNVNNGVLTLPGVSLSSGEQELVIEFGLAQALQQTTTNTYLLTNNGVRIENTAAAATLSGEVDTALFDTAEACSEKSDPLTGNRVYIYPGHGLSPANLADVFNSGNTNELPPNAIAPFAVASLLQDEESDLWQYVFGYLPAGEYTLAFACDTATDDAVNFNDLDIPLPSNQVHEITLSRSEEKVCNLEENRRC